ERSPGTWQRLPLQDHLRRRESGTAGPGHALVRALRQKCRGALSPSWSRLPGQTLECEVASGSRDLPENSCRKQVLDRLALFFEFLKGLLEALLAERIEFYAFDNSVALAIAPAGVTEDKPFGNAVFPLRDHRGADPVTGRCLCQQALDMIDGAVGSGHGRA